MSDKKVNKEEKFAPNYDLDKAGEKGVHQQGSANMRGVSMPGVLARTKGDKGLQVKSHIQKLHELIHMPKPNLPKSELDKGGAVVGGTSTGKPNLAIPATAVPKGSMMGRMGMGAMRMSESVEKASVADIKPAVMPKPQDKKKLPPEQHPFEVEERESWKGSKASQKKQIKKVDPVTRLPGTLVEKKEELKKPYESEAQRGWAHTAEGTKALGGKAKVHEWDTSSKGLKLPKHVQKSEPSMESVLNKLQAIEDNLNKAVDMKNHDPMLGKLHKLLHAPTMQKDDAQASPPANPPTPPSGVQSAQDSMRQAFHFGKSEALDKKHIGWDAMVHHLKGEGHSQESAEKIAGSINAKYVHHYKKSQAESPGLKKDSMEQQLSNTPTVLLSEKNPDEKQDAKLGEQIEHVVENHMIANKPAEQKEGHPIMEKNAIGHNLKALHRCLSKASMVEAATPHASNAGGPTQDEPKENRMTEENNKSEEPKPSEEPPKDKDKRIKDQLDIIEQKK